MAYAMPYVKFACKKTSAVTAGTLALDRYLLGSNRFAAAIDDGAAV